MCAFIQQLSFEDLVSILDAGTSESDLYTKDIYATKSASHGKFYMIPDKN